MRLFENASIAMLNLRNRIVMPAMATLFGEPDGTVSPALLAYYARRSAGGVGLVIVENTAVHPRGVNYPGTLEVHGPEFEDGLGRLAAAIKANGAAAALQLFHPGRQIHPKYAGNEPVAPSPVPCPVMGGRPRALAPDEIRDLVRLFAQGAARAKAVGFDAVEIHGAHGYLVGQFLSPASNLRDDRYGGDPERRARFAVEILEAMRGEVGGSFPIILRISADEKVPGGLTLEQTLEILPRLERAGASAFHVSAGCYPSMEWVVQPYLQPRGCLAELAAGVRRAATVPVLTVGRINHPEVAESLLAAGSADFVAMGRALIADPDLPLKAEQGKLEEIRPCVGCNVCIEAVGTRRTRCAVNPEMGREAELPAPADRPRRVLVAGAGPAGLEAALRARSLGHEVRVVEARDALGGQLPWAGVPDSKVEIRRLLEHFRTLAAKADMDVELGTALDVEAAKAYQPDQVVLATGAVPLPPDFEVKGSGPGVLSAADVLARAAALPGRVAVVGGGPVGLDVAEFLAARGADVVVLEMATQAGRKLEWNVRKMKLRSLAAKGVRVLTRSKVVRLEDRRVLYADPEGREQVLTVDVVVSAVGSTSHAPLEEELRELGFATVRVGDCRDPRGLAEAVSEGFEVALRLGRVEPPPV